MTGNVVKIPSRGVAETKRRPRQSARRAKPDWESLEIFYKTGYSYRQLASLAEADGISFQAIKQHADKHGWERDMSHAASMEAQKRLALLNFRRAGVENPSDDAVEVLAREKTLKVDTAPRARSSRKDAFEAVVSEHLRVLQRHQNRGNRLDTAWDFLMGLIEEYFQLDFTDEQDLLRAGVIRSILSTTKDGMVDLLVKLANVHARTQTTDRVTWDLDAKKEEDVKPFMPTIPRRGARAQKDDDDAER